MKKVKNIIDKFGGLSEMSRKIEVPVSTIQSWRDNGKIPHWRYGTLIETAEKLGFSIKNDLEANDNEIEDIIA